MAPKSRVLRQQKSKETAASPAAAPTATPVTQGTKRKPSTSLQKASPKKSKTRTKAPQPVLWLPEPAPLTNEDILHAHADNPTQCYVVGPPKAKWVDNAKSLAAYLGFARVDEFRDWLKDKGDEDGATHYDRNGPARVLASFQTLHEANYAKPSKKNSTNKTNVSRQSIWDQLSSNMDEIIEQMGPGANLPPKKGLFTSGTKLYPIMINITAMSMLIRANPDVFTESRNLIAKGQPGFNGCPYSSEDLHRAFLVLKFHLRHVSAAKSSNSFYDSTDETPVPAIRYFSEEQLEAARHAADSDDGPVGPGAVHPVEQMMRDEDESPELKEEDKRAFTALEADFEKGVELMDELTTTQQIPLEADAERAGIKFARPPLSRAAQRLFCERMAKKVKVLHEEKWTALAPGDEAETALYRAIDRTNASDDPGYPDSPTIDDDTPLDQQFWDLMNKVSVVSAPTPSYEEACRQLELDPKERRLLSAGGEGVVLKPWQVTGLAWALNMESGPIQGGLIADACGIGKTIQMLAVISESINTRAKRVETGEETPRFQPTLVLCPTPVIEVWFSEIRKHFPRLRPYRWYETAEKQRLAHIRDATLPSKIDGFHDWMRDNCLLADPETAAIVVISSYETFSTRGVVSKPSAHGQVEALWIDGDPEERAGELVDASKEYSTVLWGMFDRVVLDEGHKIKNPQTLASNTVGLVHAKFNWILTATPLMNRSTDYLGYLHLLWRDDMALDPLDEPLAHKHLYTDDTIVPKYTRSYARRGLYEFSKFGLPLWRLDPHLYKRTMSDKDVDYSALTAFNVLRSITQLATLRRTQATEMMVNGEAFRIGSTVPRYQICTVEVDFPNTAAFKEYEKRFNAIYKDANKKPETPKSTPRKFMAPKVDTANTGGRNFGVHRRLSLLTFNPALDTIVKKVSNNFAADVERWYHMHRDGGMGLYFRATRPVPNLPPYPDRFSFGLYLAKDAPKIQYMMGLVGKICRGDDPERVLLYGDFPMPHWNLEGILQNVGFKTGSLRSGMDASERAATIDRFNDPNSDIDVLTTTFGNSSFGLNLQHCCSNLIIMAVAPNVNLILQIIGRIHRLGQKKVQKIWIITLARSYDNILQHDQTTKMIAQLAGEADVTVLEDTDSGSEDIELSHATQRGKGKHIRRQCTAMISKLLGQRVSRAGRKWADKHRLEAPWNGEDDEDVEEVPNPSIFKNRRKAPRQKNVEEPEVSASESEESDSETPAPDESESEEELGDGEPNGEDDGAAEDGDADAAGNDDVDVGEHNNDQAPKDGDDNQHMQDGDQDALLVDSGKIDHDPGAVDGLPDDQDSPKSHSPSQASLSELNTSPSPPPNERRQTAPAVKVARAVTRIPEPARRRSARLQSTAPLAAGPPVNNSSEQDAQ